jgi:hypothetical protein
MFVRFLAAIFACIVLTSAVEARRAALVIGQGKYASLSELANPGLDARRMASLLAGHGFEVISCDAGAKMLIYLLANKLLTLQPLPLQRPRSEPTSPITV